MDEEFEWMNCSKTEQDSLSKKLPHVEPHYSSAPQAPHSPCLITFVYVLHAPHNPARVGSYALHVGLCDGVARVMVIVMLLRTEMPVSWLLTTSCKGQG